MEPVRAESGQNAKHIDTSAAAWERALRFGVRSKIPNAVQLRNELASVANDCPQIAAFKHDIRGMCSHAPLKLVASLARKGRGSYTLHYMTRL